MTDTYVPFDRYNWDLRLDQDIQYVLNPLDYNTTHTEVSWYVKEIINAQFNYHAFATKIVKRIAFGPVVLWFLFIIVIGALMGCGYIDISPSFFGFLILVVSWIWIMWAIVIMKSSFVDSILRVFFREKFFPPAMPNVERFLSYCYMVKWGIRKPTNE